MHTIKNRSMTVIAAAALGAACALSVGTATAQTQAAPKSGAQADSGATLKLSRADEGMLKDIAQANAAEIAAGKLALEKSQNADVKKFAQMMVDDHTKGLGDVQALAQSKGFEAPNDPDIKHKAMAVELKALSGKTFDTQYVKQSGVSDHEATAKLLQKTQSTAKDLEVKALATKMLPIVQGHLEHARTMSKM
ncbi:MAG: hypothetical protein JWQ73_2604 [Variovorax sp.]|jgi:putative membrane protein|nr:hypothetical protein [Variovorax sp.]